MPRCGETPGQPRAGRQRPSGRASRMHNSGGRWCLMWRWLHLPPLPPDPHTARRCTATTAGPWTAATLLPTLACCGASVRGPSAPACFPCGSSCILHEPCADFVGKAAPPCLVICRHSCAPPPPPPKPAPARRSAAAWRSGARRRTPAACRPLPTRSCRPDRQHAGRAALGILLRMLGVHGKPTGAPPLWQRLGYMCSHVCSNMLAQHT